MIWNKTDYLYFCSLSTSKTWTFTALFLPFWETWEDSGSSLTLKCKGLCIIHHKHASFSEILRLCWLEAAQMRMQSYKGHAQPRPLAASRPTKLGEWLWEGKQNKLRAAADPSCLKKRPGWRLILVLLLTDCILRVIRAGEPEVGLCCCL